MKTLLPQINPKRMLLATGGANLFSSLIGIPLAMLLRLGLELATMPLWYQNKSLSHTWHFICEMTLGAAWINPYEGESNYWVLDVATISLMIPCFFISYLFERRSIQKSLGKEIDATLLSKAVWRANLASYALLLLLVVVDLVKNLWLASFT